VASIVPLKQLLSPTRCIGRRHRSRRTLCCNTNAVTLAVTATVLAMFVKASLGLYA